MEPFEHVDAPSVEAAIALLGGPGGATSGEGPRPIAGGTDLLTTMKAGLHQPSRLVNLKTIPGLKTIAQEGGSIRIGALVTLDTLQRDSVILRHYPALAQAAGLAASPQLRNAGTLGGNLAQETRCWYYRNADFPCWLKGGDTCYARRGEHSHHAIFTSDSPCVSVYPSDPATALLALDAAVIVQTVDGEQRFPIGDYFTMPREGHRRLNRLGPADLIVGVSIPVADGHGQSSLYLKAMDRGAWSFALAGVAVVVTWGEGNGDGRQIANVRIGLGGVAPVPQRATAAETFLVGKALDSETAAEAGRLAVADATPLPETVYKVRLVRGLVARALLQARQAPAAS